MRSSYLHSHWLILALVGCSQEPGSTDTETGSATSDSGDATGSAMTPTTSGGVDGTDTDPGTDSEAGTATDSGNPPASSCKRGIAYGYHSEADLTALAPAVSWWYNWTVPPDEGVRDSYQEIGVEFVPMLWGAASLEQEPEIPAGARYLLAFNEPNFGSQANLTPQEAAALWPQVEAIADAHGLEIVSPALNYCGGSCNKTNPFEWFDEFFAACQGCRVDHLAVHWYACHRDALSGYIEQMKQYERPIWLTEFSCLDAMDVSVPVQLAYMAEALDYLENEPAVFRYSWFAGRFDPQPAIDLLGASGELTELGQAYVSAPANCP
ncbi:glycoside hydrolase family protein [Nannocystis radixulma]|uniref:Glycoside hydrolase family protein n=1 Tax=Nannocystis radixulma TaxID=2995305 RepID=A0ABT5BFK1_9BACT|nr:glycoside hydrolase family protein [Nannocystis radixulma]MDC0672919.1 glycoside hydrolase family protein [Nannocystis radixulma]